MVESRTVGDLTIWDQVAREGKRSILVGVPPGYPARKVNGVAVGCFLTPDPGKNVYTHPPGLGSRPSPDSSAITRSTSPASATGDKRKMLADVRRDDPQAIRVFRHLLAE